MRRMKLEKWRVETPEGEKEESILDMISALVRMQRPEKIPKGIEKFQVFGRIAKAFDEALKTETLSLEESEYAFIREIMEKDIPSVWALNQNYRKTVDAFLKLPEEEVKP